MGDVPEGERIGELLSEGELLPELAKELGMEVAGIPAEGGGRECIKREGEDMERTSVF